MNWNIGYANVKPSDYLDVEMSDVQCTLLNPTPKHVLMGFMTYDVQGKGAVQKIAKRRLDAIQGNINSHSKVLNNPQRLAAIEEHSELIASVAECSADVERNRLLKRQKKEKEEADKKKKKAEKVEEEAKKREEILPVLTANVLKYMNRAKEVDQETIMKEMNKEYKKAFLVDILVYYYAMKKGDASSKSKLELITLMAEKLISGDNNTGIAVLDE